MFYPVFMNIPLTLSSFCSDCKFLGDLLDWGAAEVPTVRPPCNYAETSAVSLDVGSSMMPRRYSRGDTQKIVPATEPPEGVGAAPIK